MSVEAKYMIKKMLTYNPEERVSAEEALNDEWIIEYTAIGKREVSASLKQPLMGHIINNLSKIKVSRNKILFYYNFKLNLIFLRSNKNSSKPSYPTLQTIWVSLVETMNGKSFWKSLKLSTPTVTVSWLTMRFSQATKNTSTEMSNEQRLKRDY